MRMSFTFGTLAVCLGLVLGASAGWAVSGPDGADYTFGDWSSPKSLIVPSENGSMRLERRSITVKRRMNFAPDSATESVIDLITSSGLDAAWLGPQLEHYFVFHGTIYGLHTSGSRLLLSRGRLKTDADVTEALQQTATQLGYSSLSGPLLDLNYVFGEKAIRPLRSARGFDHSLELRNIKVGSDRLTMDFNSMVGNQLEVTFDPDFGVQAAYENREPVVVLGNGMLPVVPLWSWPSEIDVASSKGAVKALRCSMDFDLNVSGDKHTEIVNVVVVERDGTVWIGPVSCRPLVLLGDQLVGIMRNPWMEPDRGELLVYASWGKIPVAYQGTTTAKGFQTALSNFNQQVQAKGLWDAFHLAKRIKLGVLFPELAGTRALSDGCMTIRSITFQGDAADILLESCQQWRVEVLLGPDLNVAGTHRLRWDHRPGQYTEVQKLPRALARH